MTFKGYAQTVTLDPSFRADPRPIARLFCAWHDLKCEQWREMRTAPTDGTRVAVITLGSTGVFIGYCTSSMGSWWLEDGGDLWPCTPIAWRPLEEITIPPVASR